MNNEYQFEPIAESTKNCFPRKKTKLFFIIHNKYLEYLIIFFVFLIFIQFFTSSITSAKPITVAEDGSGNYTNIQEAIDNADAGDTVFVHNGTYFENIVIDKTINLTGESNVNTIIDGNDTGDTVKVQANWVNLSRIHLRNSGNISNPNYYASIDIEFSNSKIENCSIINDSGYGIYINESSYNQIINCMILDNSIAGLYFSNSFNNQILDCQIIDNYGNGIHYEYSGYNVVIDSIISNNFDYGVYNKKSSYNQITNSTISFNQGYGICYKDSMNNKIEICSISNNSVYGIYQFNSSKNQLINCSISNNSIGIYFWNSENNILRNNNFINNEYGIKILTSKIGDFSQDIDKSNIIDGKTIYYLYEENNLTVDADINDIYFLGMISCENILIRNFQQNIGSNTMFIINSTKSKINKCNISYNSGEGIFIKDSSFIQITNCTISNNSGYGIYIKDSSNNTIINCSISSNSNTSIYLKDSLNIKITNCKISNNFMYGVFLYGCSNIKILNGEVSKNSKYSFYLYKSSFNELVNCTITNNSDDGIYIWEGNNNQITNSIINNSRVGIYIRYYSSNNQIINCQIFNNSGRGIRFSDSSYNIIKDCNISNNEGEGIRFNDYSSNNIISHNNIINNSDGIRLSKSLNNTITNCKISNNYYDGISIIDSWNNQINKCIVKNSNNGDGIYLYNSSNNNIINCTISNNFDNGIYLHLDSFNNSIANCEIYNNLKNGIIWFNSFENRVINCTLINNSQSLLLERTINNYFRNNTIINKKCKILIKGYNLEYFIHDIDTSNKVNNKEIYYLNNKNNLTLDAFTKGMYFLGIVFCENITIKNFIYENSSSSFLIINSKNILIENCKINNNSYYGMYFYNSSYNQITNCSISNNSDDGIYLRYNSLNNQIRNCTISDNKDYGIYIRDSSYNKITNCIISNNIDHGIYLEHLSMKNLIRNCTISNNWAHGINLGDSSYNKIINCAINNNNNDGIHLFYSSQNIILDSKIMNNSDDGFHFTDSDENQVINCYIMNNSDEGIRYSDSLKNLIENCSISNNSGTGIWLSYSSNNIINCTVIDNSQYGVNLYGSYDIFITECKISKNNDYGINIWGSSFQITDCTISFNGGLIYISQSKNNYIHHNNFIQNAAPAFSISINHWDDGMQGNFWSDYTGLDENKDGIGDVPHYISDGGNRDNYPLMGQIKTSLLANFTYLPRNPNLSDTIEFRDLSTSIEGNIVSYYWDFGDGNISFEKNPIHRYSKKNQYNIHLVILDEEQSRAECFKKLTFINMLPIVNFTYLPKAPTTWELVEFNDLSIDDGLVQSWEWNFGDGNISNKKNPSHRYKNSGVYYVSLIILDDLGEMNETIKKIKIKNSPPIANFSYSPKAPTNIDYIKFSDMSSDSDGYIISWLWDFGDGNESYEQNPNQRYLLADTYLVSLTVVDNNGGIGTFNLEIFIRDVIPPNIIRTHPTNNSELISIKTQISIIFSEPMNQSSLNNSIEIFPKINYIIYWQENTMILIPTSELEFELTYNITITTKAKDLSENNLQASYQFYFTTKVSPPKIFHTPIAVGLEGKPITILAKITSGGKIKLANLFYKIPGTKIFKKIEMESTGDNFIATIPPVDVTTQGIEYYLWATDEKNVTTHPLVNPEKNPHKFKINIDPMKNLSDLIISTKDITFSNENPKEGEKNYNLFKYN